MKKCIVFIILFFNGLNVIAGSNEINKKLEDELIKDDWIGAEKYIAELDSAKVDSCKFIFEKNMEYLKVSLIVRRILLIAEKTTCDERLNLISSHLSSEDVLLKAAAIRLAATLRKNDKLGFKKRILELKKSEKDPAIREAISKFFKNK
ncbi:MAG: hypothetical protein AABY53_08715 [Bdellovibrionota bacterium]